MNNKEKLIESILDNSVYQPDSGANCRLRSAINRLSTSDIRHLQTLITIKIEDELRRDKNVKEVSGYFT